MKLHLYGGFAEKGRTSIGVEAGGARVIVDVGINTSATGADYYPRISREHLAATDAIIVTHAHEDHIGALGWCLANGFAGRVFMTAEAKADAAAIWETYAEPAHHRLAAMARIEPLPCPGMLALAGLKVTTGRSGHIAGGSWCWLDDGRTTLGYCGDVVPASPVFAMDPAPPCDALVIDASYGEDRVAFTDRANAVTVWVRAHPHCILPTPLQGRSLELLAVLDGPLALASGIRAALAAQIEAHAWLRPGIADALSHRLAAAADWTDGTPWPSGVLLCHDGMGMGGPAKAILSRAQQDGHPVLLTGHLPVGSLGKAMLDGGRASWLRLPTHPTLPENVALAAASRARIVFGHSADAASMRGLRSHIPSLRDAAATGDQFNLA